MHYVALASVHSCALTTSVPGEKPAAYALDKKREFLTREMMSPIPLAVITVLLCSSKVLRLHSLGLHPSHGCSKIAKTTYAPSTRTSSSLPNMAKGFHNELDPSSALRTRGEFLANSKSAVFKSAALLIAGTIAQYIETAEAATVEQSSYSIKACDPSSENKNCVSTASVKDLYLYTPPWTFECSADEAFARLKGSIASDPSLTVVVKDEENRYIKVQTERNVFGGGPQDEIEFLVRGSDDSDSFVTFRSERNNDNGISDFGAVRNRLETIRKRAQVFGVMGGGLTADSYDVPLEKNGIFGQLKAFYGLQSGKGFEDLFDDDID